MSDVASNANATNRKPGGITGKGFQPGKSGNPAGWTRRRRHAKAVGELIRDYLAQPDAEATSATGRKVNRLDALIQRLAQEDPKTLLAYAYGKPVAMIEHRDFNGGPVTVLLHGHELPHVRFANCDPDADRTL